ncbi:MAG: hypothetical protein JO286_18975 [Solirubrobacterales bacterium]|nr:hypothetical protein [Solirubrobacterales bacterium]
MNRLERGAIPAEILLRRAKVLLRHADLLRELGDFPDALREVGVRGLKLAAEVCVLPPELGCLVAQLPDAVLEGRDLAWLVRLEARQIPDGQANRFPAQQDHPVGWGRRIVRRWPPRR